MKCLNTTQRKDNMENKKVALITGITGQDGL